MQTIFKEIYSFEVSQQNNNLLRLIRSSRITSSKTLQHKKFFAFLLCEKNIENLTYGIRDWF